MPVSFGVRPALFPARGPSDGESWTAWCTIKMRRGTAMTHPTRREVEREEERRNRERALDETLEESFPASDPLSTDPNPDDPGQDDRQPVSERIPPPAPRGSR